MANRQKKATWSTHNQAVLQTARQLRDQSSAVRKNAGSLNRDTSAELQRTSRQVESSLAMRIDDIEHKRSDLAQCMDELFSEIGKVLMHKELCEKEAAAKDLPLEVNKECQELRSQRQSVDLVEDEVDTALDQEASMLASVKESFLDLVDECNEQLRLLRMNHRKLESDIKDKYQAYDIDTQCATLDATSRAIDFKPESAHVDSDITPENWHGFSAQNIDDATGEMGASMALREKVDKAIKDHNDALSKMGNEVDAAFNLRIAELTDARNTAIVELKKLQLEIADQDRAIQTLEQAIFNQEAPLKLAQTRISNRSKRPNVEMVRDPAHQALVQEVQKIQAAIEKLTQQKDAAEATRRGLARAEMALEEDINVKSNSLRLDTQAMSRRQQYKYRTNF